MYVLWDGLDISYGTVTEYSIMIVDRKSTQYHDCENLRIKASMLICSNFLLCTHNNNYYVIGSEKRGYIGLKAILC